MRSKTSQARTTLLECCFRYGPLDDIDLEYLLNVVESHVTASAFEAICLEAIVSLFERRLSDAKTETMKAQDVATACLNS